MLVFAGPIENTASAADAQNAAGAANTEDTPGTADAEDTSRAPDAHHAAQAEKAQRAQAAENAQKAQRAPDTQRASRAPNTSHAAPTSGNASRRMLMGTRFYHTTHWSSPHADGRSGKGYLPTESIVHISSVTLLTGPRTSGIIPIPTR